MISRLQRLREEEGGFALVFALMVSTVVFITLTTVMITVQPGITGAKRSQDQTAAYIAARSGIDDAIAYLVSFPSCRSESRVCPAATQLPDGTNRPVTSDNLAAIGRPRPALQTAGGQPGTFTRYGQSFSWAIDQKLTPEGFLRVRSTGSYQGVRKTVVADLALRPSILAYGYYTDYESLSPSFLQRYYPARSVYLTNSTTYNNVSSSYRGSTTVPRYANWRGPSTAANCGQHWYWESPASPGRASTNSRFAESGTLGSSATTSSGTPTSRVGGCDLVFSSSMTQNGMTYSRDALLMDGAGPRFNQPVYTMWGYEDDTRDNTNPAFDAVGRYYRGDTMTRSSYLPAIANNDLVLPKSIGTDGMPENACVYTGPTRVKLNGDGTATVTSPGTTTKNPDSDAGCYPTGALPTTGIFRYRLDYATTGGGAIVARNLGAPPATGWPALPVKATQTPAAGNEVFYYPASAVTATPDPSTGAAPDGCTTSVTYSAAVNAACAWTNLSSASDGNQSITQGWTQYTNTATTKCPSTVVPRDRLTFECEYSRTNPGATKPTTDQYALLRNAVKNLLTSGQCSTGTISDQTSCIGTWLNTTGLKQANTAGRAYNYPSPSNGDRQYIALALSGTAKAGTSKSVGSSPANPTSGDPLFSFSGTPAQETATNTPLTVTVYRQTYNSTTRTWGGNVPQFTFTVTRTDWAISKQASGASYFPDEQDVTQYNSGVGDTGSTPVGSTGTRQPGDLYVEGANRGKVSLVADNDVVVTGNIVNPTGYTGATDAVSIAAGDDVRNYHPVRCLDQAATDIDNTSAGWCPNDITGLNSSNNSMISNGAYTSAHPAEQYVNMLPNGDRTIEAAVFALSGSFGTDNYNRGDAIGKLIVNGGIYQSHRGGNGVVSGTSNLSGTTLTYTYVDLQRAELPYVPPSTSGNDVRPWNVVSLSAG
ncbi:hypothetical protein [Jatrophihabitans fulvus]